MRARARLSDRVRLGADARYSSVAGEGDGSSCTETERPVKFALAVLEEAEGYIKTVVRIGAVNGACRWERHPCLCESIPPWSMGPSGDGPLALFGAAVFSAGLKGEELLDYPALGAVCVGLWGGGGSAGGLPSLFI